MLKNIFFTILMSAALWAPGIVYSSTQTLYEIVEISPYATTEEIENAYHAFIQEVDKSSADFTAVPTWQKTYQKTLEAFAILRNPEQRQAYDLTMGSMGNP